MFLLALLASLALAAAAAGESPFRDRLATKTPYLQRPGFPSLGPSSATPASSASPPVFLYVVARHGSRQPSTGDMRKLGKLERLLADRHEGDWLDGWRHPFRDEDVFELTPEGGREHFYLGSRMARRWPSLVDAGYDPDEFIFSSSETSRSGSSAFAFALGLFSHGADTQAGSVLIDRVRPVYITTDDENVDLLHRFFKICPKYQRQLDIVKDEVQSDAVYRAIMGPIGRKICADHARGPWCSDYKAVALLWLGCIWEPFLSPDSRFCSLFSDDDVEQIEFLQDRTVHATKGHGHALNHDITCPLMSDVVTHLERADPAVRGVFRFAHAETTIPLVAHLGLFTGATDERVFRVGPPADGLGTADLEAVLRSSPGAEEREEREWRTSRIGPFAANVAFAIDADNMVQVFVNEHLVALPRCGGKTACPLSEFKAAHDERATCDFDKMCDIRRETRAADTTPHDAVGASFTTTEVVIIAIASAIVTYLAAVPARTKIE